MHRLNGRIARLEKLLPPTIKEVSDVIDRVVKGTPPWNAVMALKHGKVTDEDKAILDAFWAHETWQGAKLALDAVWPRKVWERAYLDHLARQWGYKGHADCLAYQLWYMEIEPQVAAISFYATQQGETSELDKPEQYGRFCQLPQDEQDEWREAAREEIAAQYDTGEHTPKVAMLIKKIAHEYNKLAGKE